jgi:hypothetical protein
VEVEDLAPELLGHFVSSHDLNIGGRASAMNSSYGSFLGLAHTG